MCPHKKGGHIKPQKFSQVVSQWLVLIVPEQISGFYYKKIIINLLLASTRVSEMANGLYLLLGKGNKTNFILTLLRP